MIEGSNHALLDTGAGTHPRPAGRLAPEARRRAIVAVAREVFQREGYAAASMAEIAARVGGSKGTLYNYFPSKEALFAAFIEEECKVEALVAFELQEADSDVAQALTALGGRLIRFMLTETALSIHRIVVAESGRFPELGRVFYEQGPRQGMMILSEHMQRWRDEGRLKPLDPERAAWQFADLCKSRLHQLKLWNVAEASDAEIDANVESAVRIFMAAYGV